MITGILHGNKNESFLIQMREILSNLQAIYINAMLDPDLVVDIMSRAYFFKQMLLTLMLKKTYFNFPC